MEMYKDTIERSEHKYSHVTIQNGSEQDSPNVNGSPGVRKESIEIKMDHWQASRCLSPKSPKNP